MIARLLPLLLILIGFGTAHAQFEIERTSSEGKEFWLCFMKNFREAGIADQAGRQGGLRLQLFITSSFDANVRIEIDGIEFDNTVSVKANTVVNVSIPASAQLSFQENAERRAVHITADQPISVYGLSSRTQTTDTYLGLPVNILGTEYRAVCYTKIQQSPEMLSGISIVATEDGTEVTIVPRAITSTGRPANVPFTVRLSKGDVYTVVAKWEVAGICDLTGTQIRANKKISVFSGHACAYIPPKVEACNHLVEQMPPVSAWGKQYYLGMLKERSRYTYRVIASADSTKVFADSKLIAILRAGEFYENLNAVKNTQITATKPVLVAQFAQGYRNGDSVGDPMMILVTPTQQFRTEYRFATPINGDWHHYINVIAPKESIREIRLNGRPVDSNLFQRFGESRRRGVVGELDRDPVPAGETHRAGGVVGPPRTIQHHVRTDGVAVVNVDLVGGGVAGDASISQFSTISSDGVQSLILEDQSQSVGGVGPLGLVDEAGLEIPGDIDGGAMPGGGELVANARSGNRQQAVADDFGNRLLEQRHSGNNTDCLNRSVGPIATGEAKCRGGTEEGR